MLYKIPSGTPVAVPTGRAEPLSVGVYPQSGDTILVEINLSPGGPWYPWDAGAVTTPTLRTIRSRTSGIRFTRTLGSSALSVGEVL